MRDPVRLKLRAWDVPRWMKVLGGAFGESMMRDRKTAAACFTAALALLIPAIAESAQITLTQIGSPLWTPAGLVLFSAPVGNLADNFAEFTTTQQTVLPPPYYYYNYNNGDVVPGIAHPSSFDADYQNGVANAGYKTGSVYNTSDFSGGNGIYLGFEFVPTAGAPTGYSTDYANGPIIPNSLFDFSQTGEVDRDGVLYDNGFTGSVPSVNESYQGLSTTNYDGASHIPYTLAEASVFGPPGTPIDGDYTESFTFLDTAGNGYTISDSFTVVPEASGVGLLLVLPAFYCLRRPLGSRQSLLLATRA